MTHYWDAELAWLLKDAPSLLGERSTQGAVESALRSGGPGHSVASSDEHHGHLIDRLRLDEAIGPVARYRSLQKAWVQLERISQRVLCAYYSDRVIWPQGFEAFIGRELASVAMAFPPNGDGSALREATLRANQNEDLILRARRESFERVSNAHEDWRECNRLKMCGWLEGDGFAKLD